MCWEQLRQHNRQLEQFHDAVYIDLRSGEKTKGTKLHSGRRKRNKEKSGENLRVYRAHKVKKGQRRIRKQRYPYQPGDIGEHLGEKWRVKGKIPRGAAIKLQRLVDGLIKYPSVKQVATVWRRSGLTLC